MRGLSKYLFLLGFAALMGLVNACFNANAPAWSESHLAEGEILLERALLQESILWVDARSETEFLDGSIPDAILLNEDQWDSLLPEFLSIWQPEQTVVVYCSSQTCQASHALAERLQDELGLARVYVLKGGWEEWVDSHQ